MEAMTLGSNTFDSPQSYSVPSTTAADLKDGMSAYAVQHSTSTEQLPNGLGYNGHCYGRCGKRMPLFHDQQYAGGHGYGSCC